MILLLLVLVAAAAWAQEGLPTIPQAGSNPRTVVFIVVDQLRADALVRMKPLLLPPRNQQGQPGGFRYLMEEGAYHRQCFLESLPAHTATGHATLATGADPGVHGIVGNWWYPPRLDRRVDCDEDPAHGVAPTFLEGSTFGDELKLSTLGKAKVYTLALKSRAAVLLGGHMADRAIWMSPQGQWTTSSYYGALPAWAALERPQPDWLWTRLLTPSAYEHSWPANLPGVEMEYRQDLPFRPEHQEATPLANAASLELALRVLHNEKPQLLCVSLSAYDKLGHGTGPYHPMLQDMLVRLDRQLAHFFHELEDIDSVLFVLTSDHGSAPLPEPGRQFKYASGRGSKESTVARVNEALQKEFGRANHVAYFTDPHLVLSRKTIPANRLAEARQMAAEALREDPALAAAFTREQILEGRMPQTDVARLVSRSYFDGRSGDLVVVTRPFWIYSFDSGRGANHGSPWTYDTHVPLIFRGPGIRVGERYERCSGKDVAATLSALWEITPPSGCTGRVLTESLRPR